MEFRMETNDKKMQLQQCQECDYRATRKENIKAHVLRIHRKEFNFKCSQCPKQYVINSELRFHIQSFHQEKNIKCPHCEATFSVKKYLKVHLRLQHSPESNKKVSQFVTCTYSDFRCFLPVFLKNHMKVIHKDGSRAELICDECGHQGLGNNWNDFKRHLKDNHDIIYKERYDHVRNVNCPQCNKKFSFQEDMKKHIKAMHEGIKYSCDQCDYQSGYKNLLRHHIKRVHELYRYKCTLCNELFEYSGLLRDHIRVNHEGLPYVCQICCRPHILKKDLARHLVIHHTVSSLVDMNAIKEYKCESCQFQTTYGILMKTHASKFHRELFYKCGHKKFYMKGRKDDRPNCPQCNIMPTIAQNTVIRRHSKKKKQEKFPCPFCDFEMSQAADLPKHILSNHVSKEKGINKIIVKTTLK